MGLELPGALTEPLSWVGMTWPEADETKLFEDGARWIAFGATLAGIQQNADAAAKAVWSGDVADDAAVNAFEKWWSGPDGPSHRLAEDQPAAELIGAALIAFAGLTLALKIAYIVQLITLAIEVAQAIATAFVSFGATTAEIPGFVAATRVIVRELVEQVVKHITTVIKDLLERAKTLFKKVLTRDGRKVADDAARTLSKDLAKGTLTDADRAALHDYTTNDGYSTMNPFLRNPSTYSDADRAAIQARADSVSEGLAKLPDQPGTTFRGVDYSDDVLANYEPGQVVTERAFTSTSTKADVATGGFDGNTIMTITGRTGKDVAPFSEYGHEAEILYDKGSQFKVLSKTWDSTLGKWLINLQEVPK